MFSESIRPEGEDKLALLKARVESMRESVSQAEHELENATDDKKAHWENRLNQRKEDLAKAEEEAQDFEKELNQAA